MAYFECIVGSAGGGATITVTYNSTFYNKTMTCSNGTKTYTKTTTSSGSTVFSVTDEGTWTITCNSVSRTVNVVLNYSVAMMITKTVTVYGAAGATISFTDAVGSKTVTLNNSGQGSVSISFIPPSQTITFTDTNKAKNPNNLSQNYSKSITITESTTSIKVMPNGAIYWYGNRAIALSSTGWTYDNLTTPDNAPTYNTNDVVLTCTAASNHASFVGTANQYSLSKICAIGYSTNSSGSSQLGYVAAYASKDASAGSNESFILHMPLNTKAKVEKSITAGNYYISISTYYITNMTKFDAVWFE